MPVKHTGAGAPDGQKEGKKFEIYAGCSQPDEKSKELTGIMPVKIIWEK